MQDRVQDQGTNVCQPITEHQLVSTFKISCSLRLNPSLVASLMYLYLAVQTFVR